jgi:hypothetical protein
MLTNEELRAKSEATRLRNLLTKDAQNKPLSQHEKSALKRLKARAKKAETQQAAGAKPKNPGVKPKL